MKDALDVHRALLTREVPHEVVRLPRPVSSADDIAGALGLPAHRVAVVRLYLADDQLCAILVRSGAVPHPVAALAALQAQTLRTAPPHVVSARTDFAPGLVSPLLLPPDIAVLADACVGHTDVLYTATGDPGTALGIPTRWLLTTTSARVAELCVPDDADDVTPELLRDLLHLGPQRSAWR